MGVVVGQAVQTIEGIVVVLVLQLDFIGGLDVHDIVEPIHQIGAEVIAQAVVGLAVVITVAVISGCCGRCRVVEPVL